MPAQVTPQQIARKLPQADLSQLPTSNPGGGKPWLSGGAVVVGNYAGNTVDWSAIANKPTEFTPTAHTHDDRYYTKSQIDAGYAKLSGGNSFSGNQSVTGNITASGTVDGTSFRLTGTPTTALVPSGGIWNIDCTSGFRLRATDAAYATRFQVDGSGNVNIANLSQLSVDGGLSPTLKNVGGLLNIGNLSGGNGIRFMHHDGATEWARFVPAGRLLVGTTTDNGSSRLQVSGAVTIGAMTLTGGSPAEINGGASRLTFRGNSAFIFYRGGNEFSVDADGGGVATFGGGITATGTLLATNANNSGRFEVRNGTSGNLVVLGDSSTGNVTINNSNSVGGAISLQSQGTTQLWASTSGVNVRSAFNVYNAGSGNPSITLRDDLNYFGLNADKRLVWSSSTGNQNFFSGTVGLSLARVSGTQAAFYTTPTGTTPADLLVGGVTVPGSFHTVSIGPADATYGAGFSAGNQLLFHSTAYGLKAAIGFNNSGGFLVNGVALGPVTTFNRVECTLGYTYAPAFCTDATSSQEKGMFSAGGVLYLTVNRGNQLAVDGTGVSIAGLLTASGVITSGFRSLSANPTTLDIASNREQLVKNTTNGELRRWANDGGSMKSILYA